MIQSNKAALRLDKSIISHELHLVLSGVDSDDTVIAELLAHSRVLLQLHDARRALGSSLVSVQDCHLRIHQVCENMRLESHSGADGVMAVDDQEQHSIVVRQIRDCESSRTGLTNLELKLVTCLQLGREIPARLVSKRLIRCQTLGFATKDIQRSGIWVSVAHPQMVLELKCLDETLCAPVTQRFATSTGQNRRK